MPIRNRRIHVGHSARGSREEEKFRTRDTRNLARTRETGTRARVREQVRRLSPGEDSRGCRSTSRTPRILRLRNLCGLSHPGGY